MTGSDWFVCLVDVREAFCLDRGPFGCCVMPWKTNQVIGVWTYICQGSYRVTAMVEVACHECCHPALQLSLAIIA